MHSEIQYVKANNKYMKYYNKNKESSYIKCWDVNNLYGWEMPQKLPLNGFKWVEETFQFNESFIKSYEQKSDEGWFVEVDVKYPEKLYDHLNDVPFLTERIKTRKIEEIRAKFHDKEEYVIHINKLKQALNHGLVLKKVYKVIDLNQKALLKPYIDMNIEVRKNASNDFGKMFFKLLNKAVFISRLSHRGITLVKTET